MAPPNSTTDHLINRLSNEIGPKPSIIAGARDLSLCSFLLSPRFAPWRDAGNTVPLASKAERFIRLLFSPCDGPYPPVFSFYFLLPSTSFFQSFDGFFLLRLWSHIFLAEHPWHLTCHRRPSDSANRGHIADDRRPELHPQLTCHKVFRPDPIIEQQCHSQGNSHCHVRMNIASG